MEINTLSPAAACTDTSQAAIVKALGKLPTAEITTQLGIEMAEIANARL